MSHPILGLHHVTATVDHAQDDIDFAVGALGLRLVKKTVNFDNHHVYHFYYGDERGTPGTIWTTFPYAGHGVAPGRQGTGQVVTTSFSVPAGSLAFWRARLSAHGIAATDVADRFGDAAIACADASGLEFELIANKHDHRSPWLADGIEADSAIRGLHSVTLLVASEKGTLDLMTAALGYHIVDRQENRVRLAVGNGAPGKIIDVVVDAAADHAVNGVGTVHHVAMAIDGADAQLKLRDELIAYGCRVTEVRDRCYFTSIYFREPGGVLFEVATMAPGFAIDETLDDLGTALKLPPWEESHRKTIEAGLAHIEVP
jgi:glyoxalase family protein